tara:strand:- start:1294 stop:1503 length:210 start_codon:yes stop_codon:yes gene_type:complete
VKLVATRKDGFIVISNEIHANYTCRGTLFVFKEDGFAWNRSETITVFAHGGWKDEDERKAPPTFNFFDI